MWILVILNGIGLLSGVIINNTVMYVIFAISFLAFFHKYAVVSWNMIYEDRVESSGIMDAKVANEFVCFFVMACIFWEMVHKVGQWCAVVTIAQCIIFHIFKYLRNETNQNFEILICYVAELLLSVMWCFS